MKSVLLAGGRGQRMLPSTQIHNKHLLPVYTNRGSIPMIWYPLSTLVKSGCKEVLIISSQEHAGDIIEFLGDGSRFGIDITYKIQDHNDPTRPVGIASALKLAKDFVNHEYAFAVILGDNFYQDTFANEFSAFSSAAKSNLLYGSSETDYMKGHIFLKEVADPERFGVATLSNGFITKIVEKPKVPESNYAVTGLYLFTPGVFNITESLKVSARGELEVSDINDALVKIGGMTASTLPGYWSDMGIPSSMLRTQEFINSADFKLDFK